VLVHEDLVPPDDIRGMDEKKVLPLKTEYDVVSTLRNMGHEAEPLGVLSDLGVIRTMIRRLKPHVAFNLLEEFHGVALYDQHVVSYLELLRQPYTGCNPRGLTLAHDKALSKKLLAFHRIPAPRFKVFPIGRKVRRPAGLPYPLLVKSLIEEASLGIAQASVVTTDEKLEERVAFVHERLGTDAIAEQFIEGRELYLGILGNQRLRTLPIWELKFTRLPEGSQAIATEKVKWDESYQKRIGVMTGPATDLPPGTEARIARLCKRAYRVLGLSGYARIDMRMTPDGKVYVIEANPNPQLAHDEEFAESAHHAGIAYETLLQKILNLGMAYRAQWRESEA